MNRVRSGAVDDPYDGCVRVTVLLEPDEARRYARFAERRGLSVRRVVQMLADLARLGDDGTLSVAPLKVGVDAGERTSPQAR